MDNEDPVQVFEGPYTEAVFVKTLLEGSGITASRPTRASAVHLRTYCLFVQSTEAERARELVDHFRQHGRRSESS